MSGIGSTSGNFNSPHEILMNQTPLLQKPMYEICRLLIQESWRPSNEETPALMRRLRLKAESTNENEQKFAQESLEILINPFHVYRVPNESRTKTHVSQSPWYHRHLGKEEHDAACTASLRYISEDQKKENAPDGYFFLRSAKEIPKTETYKSWRQLTVQFFTKEGLTSKRVRVAWNHLTGEFAKGTVDGNGNLIKIKQKPWHEFISQTFGRGKELNIAPIPHSVTRPQKKEG